MIKKIANILIEPMIKSSDQTLLRLNIYQLRIFFVQHGKIGMQKTGLIFFVVCSHLTEALLLRAVVPTTKIYLKFIFNKMRHRETAKIRE